MEACRDLWTKRKPSAALWQLWGCVVIVLIVACVCVWLALTVLLVVMANERPATVPDAPDEVEKP